MSILYIAKYFFSSFKLTGEHYPPYVAINMEYYSIDIMRNSHFHSDHWYIYFFPVTII